jgi:hypothetical protein
MTEQRPPKRAKLKWPGTRQERRRALLLPLGAATLVGGTLALFGVFGGGERNDEATREAETQIEAARASLTESLVDKREGISVRYPKSWRSDTLRGEHLLESRDRCMAIKISTPAAASQAGRLRRDTLAALRRGFKRIQVTPGDSGKQIGGIPTTQDVITVQAKQGAPARILVAVGRGKKRAYLTEFVLRHSACGRALIEAQLALTSARYTR